MKVNTEPACY